MRKINSTNNYSGFTLVELLVTMTLSILLVSAVIPLNQHAISATELTQSIQKRINQINRISSLIEADLKMAGSSFCTDNNNLINDHLFQSPIADHNTLIHSWISGFEQGSWYPKSPFFSNQTRSQDNAAINILFPNLTTPLSMRQILNQPERIIYTTNCSYSEITRVELSEILKSTSSQTKAIFPFQSVMFYLRDNGESKTLYRQYLTTTGRSRNEPILDNFSGLKIAYGELLNNSELNFLAAHQISNWSNVIAVYMHFSLSQGPIENFSTLLKFPNHEI